MNRLAARLDACRSEGRGALSVYLAGGYPSIEASEAYIQAAIRGGADFLEIGFPFSDPAADGPVIQRATAAAIASEVRVDDLLAMVQRVRETDDATPLVCMTYANIAYRMGWDQFAARLADAGFDGAIVPDVPLEESGPLRAALASHDVAWIPLVTPTTTTERMRDIAASATGFLYVVSNVGITGQGDPGPLVESVVSRARSVSASTPLVVGFGLQTAADVRRVLKAGADGAIVGSAIVARTIAGCTPNELEAAVVNLRAGARA